MGKPNHLKFIDELAALLDSYRVDLMRPSLDGKTIEFLSNGHNLVISKYNDGCFANVTMENGDYTAEKVKE